MTCIFVVIATFILALTTGHAQAAPQEDITFTISEKISLGNRDSSAAQFDSRARALCLGDYEVTGKAIDKNKVKSTLRCLATAKSRGEPVNPVTATEVQAPVQVQDRPKETFAKLRPGIGLVPTCSGENIVKGHLYCGEKYSVAFAMGPAYLTRLSVNHYSLHKAESRPRLEENATKWRKEEVKATSLMVSQGTNLFGLDLSFGLGFFGATLSQREWIEYPFPQEDETLAKERGNAKGLAMEVSVDRTFAETVLGSFNIGLSATGLFPSTTSNPRVESKYWVLPALEFSWKIDLKK